MQKQKASWLGFDERESMRPFMHPATRGVQMTEQYRLEKWIWTDGEFDDMNWHACTIHAFASPDNYDLALDIDYIFRWVNSPDKKSYNFWIAPATLVFENVTNIDFQFFSLIALGIDVIERIKAAPKEDSELGPRR